jgi:hypothetical protein
MVGVWNTVFGYVVFLLLNVLPGNAALMSLAESDRGMDQKYVEAMALFTDPLLPGWKPRDLLWEVALKEGYAAWDEQLKARNIKWQERITSPWFYDTVEGKWEVHSAKGDRGSYFGAFEYVPSRKGYVQCSYSRQADVFLYDPQARSWKRSRAAGGPNGIDASGCLDTRRDRVYYGGSSGGAKNPAENFFAYDLKTDTWKKLNLAADRWRQNMSSFQAFFHYDAGADRLVAIATPNCPAAERKIYAYDPEADRCEEPRALPPEVLKDTEGCAASSAF